MPAESVIERLREMVESPCTLQYLMANKADVALLLAVAEAASRWVDEGAPDVTYPYDKDLIAAVRALRAGGSDV